MNLLLSGFTSSGCIESSAHVGPLYPLRQLHVKLPSRFAHLPPWLHGWLAHSFISEIVNCAIRNVVYTANYVCEVVRFVIFIIIVPISTLAKAKRQKQDISVSVNMRHCKLQSVSSLPLLAIHILTKVLLPSHILLSINTLMACALFGSRSRATQSTFPTKMPPHLLLPIGDAIR